MSIRDARSLLHFGVFVIFALGATLFVLEKADEAIAEIENLNNSQVFIVRGDLTNGTAEIK